MAAPDRRLANTVGIDDAPFALEHRGDVPVVGAVCTGPRLDGVLVGRVRRDGANATARLAALLNDAPFREHIQLILLQGVALAGFNVVDVVGLHRRTQRPVLVVMRRPPDMAAVRRALLERVPGGERKWRLVKRLPVPEPMGGLHVQRIGLSTPEARSALARLCVHGALPEPLRLAHLLAGGMARGFSRGRA